MVHKSALWRTFRLAAAAVLTAPEGWQDILFSTLGKKWVQVTYMDPLRVRQEMRWMASNSKQISHFCVPTTRQVTVVLGLRQVYAKPMPT